MYIYNIGYHFNCFKIKYKPKFKHKNNLFAGRGNKLETNNLN